MIQIPNDIRYMMNAEIAYRAESLLESYNRDLLSEPMPVRVEHLVENYLQEREGLQFDIVNLNWRDQLEGVVGIYDIRAHQIFVERDLYESPDRRDRRIYYFTLAHELGHDQLHGRALRSQAMQLELFEPPQPMVFRTLRRTLERPIGPGLDVLERQANYFAACLLMPEEAVREQFARLGYERPIALEEEPGFRNTYELALDVARELNDVFDVNVSAMAYRLMRLGLVVERLSKRLRRG